MDDSKEMEKKVEDSDSDNLFDSDSDSNNEQTKPSKSKEKNKIAKNLEDDSDNDNEKNDGDDKDETNYPTQLEYDEDLDPKPLPKIIRIPDGFPNFRNKFVRGCNIPGFLHLEPCVFDPNLFDERMEAERLKSIGKEPDLVGDNIIRWRFKLDENGHKIFNGDTPVVEGNSRIVEWEDGSLQLLIGDEAFNLEARPQRNKVVYTITDDVGISNSEAMEAVALISGSIKVKPLDMQTKFHKKFSLANKAKNSLKAARVKEILETDDPLAKQDERIREIEERNRRKQRERAEELGTGKSSKAQYNQSYFEDREERSKTPRRRPTRKEVFGDSDSDDDEDEDDEEEEEAEAASSSDESLNLGSNKKRKASSEIDEEKSDKDEESKEKKPAATVRADDDDDDDDEIAQVRSSKKKKKVLDSDSD